MIRTVRDKRVQQLMDGVVPRRFPTHLARATEKKLKLLDMAERIEDLLVPPSNRLERLRGDRKGLWSIRINRQWRICFRWETDSAYDVEIIDYH
ncbi:Toxin HigB [hydrothermal vent metagenome]|uniref:Toxin HigB n=1 Tax=hydrothermal vent metagenome TaxID=652676 RepID=A0A3B0R7Y0_9ZZZZ